MCVHVISVPAIGSEWELTVDVKNGSKGHSEGDTVNSHTKLCDKKRLMAQSSESRNV